MKKKQVTKSRLRLGACITAVFMCAAACGDTINLKRSVRLAEGDREINLGDIAELTGEHALALADLVVMTLDNADAPIEIPIANIRAILDASKIHWGRIQLNGHKVIVRPGRSIGQGTLLAMSGASIVAPDSKNHPQGKTDHESAATLTHLSSIRGEVAAFVCRGLKLPPQRVRLAFDRADGEFLDQLRADRRIEIELASSLHSDRISMNVRLWSANRIVDRRTLTMGILLDVETVLPVRDMARHEELRTTDLITERAWLPPSEAGLLADHDEAVGRVASSRLREGQPLRHNAIRKKTLISKGDQVMVRCIVGGTVISLQAEARAEGSEGDIIEFRKKGERETFLATVVSSGEAIVDLSRHGK